MIKLRIRVCTGVFILDFAEWDHPRDSFSLDHPKTFLWFFWHPLPPCWHFLLTIKSRVLTRYEAHAGLFRLSMKGIFNAYILWPFGKNFIFELVSRVRTRDYTVLMIKNSRNKTLNKATNLITNQYNLKSNKVQK